MQTSSSRRQFLQRATSLSFTTGLGPLAANLAAMGQAAAAGAADYKALVCVFLLGGNDNFNTVVPYDESSHAKYFSQRPAVGLRRQELHRTVLNPTSAPFVNTSNPRPLAYALNPNLPQLAARFNAGQMAVMLNIGTLKARSSLQDFKNNIGLPPKLFSHNDQQSFYQSSGAEGSTRGWGGGLASQFAPDNPGALFSAISAGGNHVFLAGEHGAAYQVTANGAVRFGVLASPLCGSQACADALQALMTAPRVNRLEADLVDVVQRSLAAERMLSPALAALPSGVVDSFNFPADNPLAAQLSIVARIIAARTKLNNGSPGPSRQVFFVTLQGFDTHDHLRADHDKLMSTLDGALNAFYDATEKLGLANQVTTFTASDFGRTLGSDGDGSDHGWGSVAFVLGGDVNGRAFYGRPPDLDNGSDDTGRGRLLPFMAVDQFAAQLGQWFGVTRAEDLNRILPNWPRFAAETTDPVYSRNFGFMKNWRPL